MSPHRAAGQSLVEVGLILPAVLVAIVVVLAIGIAARTDGGIGAVADEAARAGALASDSSSAATAARQRGLAVAAGYGLDNGSLQIQVDTTDFRRGGDVRVLVTYSLPLDQLPLLGWAAVPFRHAAAEPIAPNRSFRP